MKNMQNIKEFIQSLSVKEKVNLLTNLKKANKKSESVYSLNFKNINELVNNNAIDLPIVSTSWDNGIIESAGVYAGKYARSTNVEVLMMTPAKLTHSSSLVKTSSISEDPYLTGKMLSSFIMGVQNNLPVALSGISFDKSMNSFVDEDLSERTIKEFHIKPFEIAIKESSPEFVITSNEDFAIKKNNVNKNNINPYLHKGIDYKNIVVAEEFNLDDFLNEQVISLQGNGEELTRLVTDYNLAKEKLENGEILNLIR